MESTSMPIHPHGSIRKSDGLTNEKETDVKEAEKTDKLWQHLQHKLAKKYYKQRKYEAMESALVKVDEKTKSAMGRVRFANMLSQGFQDFTNLHDRINPQMKNINVLHDRICQQIIVLAESHREILQEMEVETQCNIFVEWAKLSEAVFRQNSTLEYGSFQWEKVISKTIELAQFFSSLPTAAKNVSKSYILLILQFICRVWIIRNHILPSDHHGLLRIATFCLQLCESDLITSKYYCKFKHDIYVHAVITLGCTISNKRLDVETWYEEFCTFKLKSEQYYDEGLKLNIDIRSTDDTRNLEKFSRKIESMYAYIGKFEDDSKPDPRGTDEHNKLIEQHVNRIMKHWNCKNYSEFCQSIIDAEDVLYEADFKLQIGRLLSPKFNQVCDVLNGSIKQMSNPCALFENLHANIKHLVVDYKRLLKELKVYSNDSMADWVEDFFRFCSSDDCSYGSVRWKKALGRCQDAVDDTTNVVDLTGRAIMQLYVQLIIELVMEAFFAFEHLDPGNRIGHVRVTSMNITIVKSPLFANSLYSKIRYNVYICGLRSLAECILNEDPPDKYAFYEQYKVVKEILDSLIVESGKAKVQFVSKQDRYKLSTLHKDVQRKLSGIIEKTSAYDSTVVQLIKSTLSGCIEMNFEQMASGYSCCQLNFGVPSLILQLMLCHLQATFFRNAPTINEEHHEKTFASNPKVAQLVRSAVHAYIEENFDQMTRYLDSAEKEERSLNVLLAFAGNISTNFDLVITFSNNIPEKKGLCIVKETTKKNLQYLANDHQTVMKGMGETTSDIMQDLVVTMFEQTDAMPGTGDWELLKIKALDLVKYFEGLTENGQSVTKAFILLLLTVLHNFIATWGRLRSSEHYKRLPFLMPCVIVCESTLLESDAWIKPRFDVYKLAVFEACASLGTGQLPCFPSFPKYSRGLQELRKKATECNIYVCNVNQQQRIDKVCKDGFEFYRGSEDRMCITAALIYYNAGCYTGMMAILNAADQTSNALNIRMNFAMQVSRTFEICIDSHNSIANESTYVELSRKAYVCLCKASDDFSDFVKKMGETSSNDLRNWVDNLFQVTSGSPSLNPNLEMKSVTEKSEIAAQYIMSMSKEARCVSQIYLYFFMSIIAKFISRRSVLYEEDLYNYRLKIAFAVIILCKDVFVTSNFSIEIKKQIYYLAASYMAKIKDESDVFMSEMETVVNEFARLNELHKEFEEDLKRRAAAKKDWPGDYEDTEYEREEKQRATNTNESAEHLGIEKLSKDFSTQPELEDTMSMTLLLMDRNYKYEHILPWNVFSEICLSLDSCNAAMQDWRALAEKWGVKAKTIRGWNERNTVNPTKTMLFSFFSKNAHRLKFEVLSELRETLMDLELGYVAELVSKEMTK